MQRRGSGGGRPAVHGTAELLRRGRRDPRLSNGSRDRDGRCVPIRPQLPSTYRRRRARAQIRRRGKRRAEASGPSSGFQPDSVQLGESRRVASPWGRDEGEGQGREAAENRRECCGEGRDEEEARSAFVGKANPLGEVLSGHERGAPAQPIR